MMAYLRWRYIFQILKIFRILLCVSIYMFTYINLYVLIENATQLKFNILNSNFYVLIIYERIVKMIKCA